MRRGFLSKLGKNINLPSDKNFCPAVIWNRSFLEYVNNSEKSVPITINITKENNSTILFKTKIFSEESKYSSYNYYYIEQLVKTLLWIYGGYKIIIGGPKQISEHIKRVYSQKGKRSFDIKIMSKVYEKPFIVKTSGIKEIPKINENPISLGRHLNGCRIGFDLGASDRKVSAVIDGETVFSEEVIWNPSEHSDPSYHYHEIMSMLHRTAANMPRVDAIGGSSAGIYINDRVMIASLFRSVPLNLFERKVKNLFLDIQKVWGVPLKIINDGEVTALAGSMSLEKNAVLGIAMGSSEAGGYINSKGTINPWLNELAFVPVDFNPAAAIDEWSGDMGCGVQYFSQQAVIRLLGYSIAYYAEFYEIETILILGRVTSGEGGQIILQKAREILSEEFPKLFKKISLNLPDEASRRVGQSIAAASLPILMNK